MKVIFVFAFLLGPHMAVGQSCYERCQGSCKDLSGHINAACVDTCNRAYCENKNDSQPRPFGAIAFGTDRGAEGISWNKGNQAEADQAALASCSKTGNNCKVVYRYRDTCAALAVAAGAQHYEPATGDTEKSAQANATAVCQKNWGRCLSDISACSLTGARRPRTAPAPRAVSWGAIAYSAGDMGAGTSQAKPDRASAEEEAMKVCAQRGKSCVIRAAFNKQCGALAADGNVVGSAVAADQREAQQKAIADCTRAGGSRCVLHILFCSN